MRNEEALEAFAVLLEAEAQAFRAKVAYLTRADAPEAAAKALAKAAQILDQAAKALAPDNWGRLDQALEPVLARLKCPIPPQQGTSASVARREGVGESTGNVS